MRNYNEFPQLARMASPRRSELIALACLSRTDETIARMRLIDGCDYADIGAAVNMDRTGVSKRLRKTIVPRIEMFI
jgi:DNA-directed RNA polymerase specialized sigma24 family protein